jgi:hypothetical protein
MGARDFDNTPRDVEATEVDMGGAFKVAVALMQSHYAANHNQGAVIAIAVLAAGGMIAKAIYSLEATIVRGRQ